MAISITNSTAGNDLTTQTTRATASISVTSGLLYLLGLYFDRDPGTVSLSGNSETYTLIQGPQLWDATRYMYTYRMRANATASYSITAANTNTAVCMWSVEAVTGEKAGGTNGSAAIGAITGLSANATTSISIPTLTLASATSSAVYAHFGHKANEVTTPKTAWTELSDKNLASTHGHEAQWAIGDGDARASWTTSSDSGGQATEILIAVVVTPDPGGLLLSGVGS